MWGPHWRDRSRKLREGLGPDGAGHRLTTGTYTYTYTYTHTYTYTCDERDRLLTGPDGSFTYTPQHHCECE